MLNTGRHMIDQCMKKCSWYKMPYT